MKKNLFSWMAMATVLLMASCTSDELVNEQSGEYVTASFTVATPEGMNSRAVGDGTTVDEVACAVFNVDGELTDLRQYLPISGKKATYSIRLVKGQAYHVAFFAYKSNGTKGKSEYYDVTSMENIKVTGGTLSALSNLEGRDAFTAQLEIPARATMNAINQDITLKRPFAQLNIGSTDEDWKAAISAGITVARTQVKVTNVYTAFNARTSKVAGESTTLTFNMNTIPANMHAEGEDEEKLMVKENPYKYLALNYLLVGDQSEEKSLTDVEFKWEASDGKTNDPTTNFRNVPVQRNWRTNIIGSILTNPAQFNIEIDEEFGGEYIVNPWDGSVEKVEADANGNYSVSNAAQLRYIAQEISDKTIKSGTITLANDIDLNNEPWTPINVWDPENAETITLDGAGHKILNMNIKGGGQIGFIGSSAKKMIIKDLTFVDPKVESTASFVGTVIGYQYGDVTLENVKVTGADIKSTAEKGIRIGGLVGFSALNDGAKLTLTNCVVENSTITGYHNVAGLVGTLVNYDANKDKWTLSGNSVTGCTFNVTNESASNVKYASPFAVDGGSYPNTYEESITYFSGNTASNNTFNRIILVYTLDRLKEIVAEINGGDNYAGKTIALKADIDLKNEVWTPIGSGSKQFAGTFDGGNHSILNVEVEGNPNQGLGFIGQTSKTAVVKDVHLIGCKVTQISNGNANQGYAGGLVGWNRGIVENCSLTAQEGNPVTVNGGLHTGGLVGQNEQNCGVIKNCKVVGPVQVTSASIHVGGLVGYNIGMIQECSVINEDTENAALIMSTRTGASHTDVGGIAGFNLKKSSPATDGIINCHVKGNIELKGEKCTGGILGYGEIHVVEGCTVEGVKIFADVFGGGLIGRAADAENLKVPVKNCSVSGVSFKKFDGTDAVELTNYEKFIGNLTSEGFCTLEGMNTVDGSPVQ